MKTNVVERPIAGFASRTVVLSFCRLLLSIEAEALATCSFTQAPLEHRGCSGSEAVSASVFVNAHLIGNQKLRGGVARLGSLPSFSIVV